jgi:antirestriction protein ArdC
MYTLVNDLSAGIYNPNVAYNQSWIHVHNDANRALFSQAAYITNFDDLTISLSAGNVDIGAI